MALSSPLDQQKLEFKVNTNLKELAQEHSWAFEVIASPTLQVHYPSNTIEEDLLYALQHWGQLLQLPPAQRVKLGREEYFYHLHCAVGEEIAETFRCKIPHAAVIGLTGLVITSNLEIVAQSVNGQKLNANLNMEKIREKLSQKQFLAGTHVLLLSHYTLNYAHWLMDCLPKLALLESFNNDLKFIVPDESPDYLIDSLKLLGIQENQLVRIKEESILVEELIFCHAAQKSGRPSKTHLLKVRNQLLASFPNNPNRCSTPKRIYVSRSHSSRRIINEDEILKILGNYNFETMHCEEMSLIEQICAFSNAEAILGPHGAGMYNQIFCNSGATIIEIYNKEYWHHSSRIISGFLGHTHWHVFGENAGEDGQTWVDPIKLDKLLFLALYNKTIQK